MAAPKVGKQRMAIAAEPAAVASQVNIVKAVKSPAVLELLGNFITVMPYT